ncbi:MAG TPA: ribosome biogenesis GTPase Der [Acidimicrobiales bacterium]|nr:ribosome biogenesis GTPase Der [Acidimicrobiales bacterium]
MRRTLPVVVVAGRPNVGKSTLVNRIVGRQVAIVERNPGVTRDRLELKGDWAGEAFRLIDTGGLLEGGDALDDMVSEQAITAVNSADVVLFVLDATTGVTGEDAVVAGWLRRVRDKVIVVANKVDNERREAEAWELASLGLGTPVMISALHGRGVGDLLDTLVGRFASLPAGTPGGRDGRGDADSAVDRGRVRPIRTGESFEPGAASEPGHPGEGPADAGGADDESADSDGADAGGADDDRSDSDRTIAAVAIVGRPNVGKSTLFNRLVGEERSIVHDLPGTTRDAIDTVIDTEVGSLRLVDTAGMRRRAREGDAPEYFSLVRSLRALDRSDVALLVLDATEGVTHQDQRLAERVDASGSPAVILLNKWDLLSTDQRLDLGDQVAEKLAFLGYAPVLRISAKTGLGVHRLLPVIDQAIAAYHRRIPTSRLNEALKAAQSAHPAPGARILYAVQGAIDPPTVTLFATRRLPPPYLRYLERSLRERFDLGPTPIEMRVRVRAQR